MPAHRHWTADEDTLIRPLPAAEAAARAGRTLDAVYARRRRLAATRPGWTPAEDEAVRTLPVSEAVKATGRTRPAVLSRRQAWPCRTGEGGEHPRGGTI